MSDRCYCLYLDASEIVLRGQRFHRLPSPLSIAALPEADRPTTIV